MCLNEARVRASGEAGVCVAFFFRAYVLRVFLSARVSRVCVVIFFCRVCVSQVKLVRRLLVWDAHSRITAERALGMFLFVLWRVWDALANHSGACA